VLTNCESATYSIPIKFQERDNCVTKSFLLLARYVAFQKNPAMDYGFNEISKKTSGNGRDQYKASKEKLIEAMLASILEKDLGVLKSEKNPKLQNFLNEQKKRTVDRVTKKNIVEFNKDIMSTPNSKRSRGDGVAHQSRGAMGSKRNEKHTTTTPKKVFNPAILKKESSINSLIVSGKTEELESYLSLKNIDKHIKY
jgi:hypothetical protein